MTYVRARGLVVLDLDGDGGYPVDSEHISTNYREPRIQTPSVLIIFNLKEPCFQLCRKKDGRSAN